MHVGPDTPLMLETTAHPSQPGAPATWLQRGQQLEANGQFAAAVACYDRARAGLGEITLPADADRRALSVVCMNRGSALRQIGDTASLAASLAAYDEAIALQRLLPPAPDSLAPNSLAAALMNRAQLLHRLHGTACASEALGAADEAADLLRPLLAAAAHPAPRRNLAGTLVNRANLLLDLGQFASAASSAREALALVVAAERADPVEAGLALMARRALCDALGQLLVVAGNDQEPVAREAGDVVDESLVVVRHWVARGENGFQPLATRLFRFGARLYRAHQPQFLAEFLFEHLDACAEPTLVAIAEEVLALALADLQRPQLFLAGTPGTQKSLDLARSLRSAQARLSLLNARLSATAP